MSKKRSRKTKSSLDAFVEAESAKNAPVSADVEILQGEVRALQRRLRHGEGKANLIVRCVEEALAAKPLRLPAIKAPRRDVRIHHRHPEVAVLHLSDLHFGKITKSFDSAVAAKRIVQLAEKVMLIADVRRSAAPVRELHVYLGGDIVEGEQIFPGQAHLIDSPLYEQACINAPQSLAGMLRAFLGHFEKVSVKALRGNHGRDSKHADPRTNWDLVACRTTELMLSENGKHPARLDFEITPEFYFVDRIFSWGNLVVHGDSVRGQLGFPWYNLGKKVHGWAGSLREPWDYLYMGHWHTFTFGTFNDKAFAANGTLESDNEYALEQMAAAGHPCQRLTFYTAQHGLINDNQVWLTDERKSTADRWRQWAESQAGAGRVPK